MPSPVRYTQHGHPHALLSTWLGLYAAATRGVAHGIDATLRLDFDNEVQPDLMLRVAGPTGRSRIDHEHYVDGAPELLVEVAASSVSYDLHQKLHVYRRAGVQEYLVLRTEDAAVDWFVLRGGAYERMVADASGILQSLVFPGLSLDVAALLRADDAAMHATLRASLATPAHEVFVLALA